MEVFCGIDWAEDHHDIALAGRDGQLLARRRISDDPTGLAVLLELPASHGDTAGDLIPVAIETPRGLLTACLPGDPDHMPNAQRLLHVVADRQKWHAALTQARARASGEPDSSYSATGRAA